MQSLLHGSGAVDGGLTRIALWVLLPILLNIAIGFVFERLRPIDPRTLSQTSIYVLSPCLVFHSLLTTKLTARDIASIAAFVYVLTAAQWLVAKGWAKARRMSPGDEAAFILSTVFMNAGNYGIPLCLYAFGSAGMERAVVWVLVQNAGIGSLAVYYAARESVGVLQAVKTIFTMPAVYAAALAGLLRLWHVSPPAYVMAPMQSLGLAMVPMAQLLLGAQLARSAKYIKADAGRIAEATALRLVGSPFIGMAIAAGMGLTGLGAHVMVTLSSMPTAVNASILAIEFGAQPRFVSGVVFCSTVASFVTLTVLLRALG